MIEEEKIIDFAKTKLQKIRKEVGEAYADCWLGKEGMKRRNLDFKASGDVSKAEAIYILKQAIPNGYNMFDADLLENLPGDVRITIAREGSVCLYIGKGRGKGIADTHYMNYEKWLMADEFDVLKDGTVRLWWD
jgi:hypothetical protein